MLRDIITEIENFGECFIGTFEVQGMKVFKRYNRIEKAWNKEHAEALAYDSKTGIVWITK